ncbi:MAG: MFS transporter [Bacteroidetes bacterium]|nr:MFS transporter [Bacteroidota bacterium]
MSNEKHDPFAVLKIKDYQFFLTFRFFLTMAIQMQSVIVGWQVYSISGSVLDLGLIGLAEAIPFILISIFSGHIADTFNRKKIIVLFTSIFILASAALLYLSVETSGLLKLYGTFPIFILVGIIGIIRGFMSAALSPFLSQLLPRKLYGNGATWNSTIWHLASIIGPSISGFLVAIDYMTAYGLALVFISIALFSLLFIPKKETPAKEEGESIWESISVGVKFVMKNQLVLGALSLDLFAVLFGGAVALLPDFAKNVLNAGPVELGYLRAAPAFGAAIMALIIAYRPPVHNAGKILLYSVAGFGVSTILFGLSTNFWLALFFLFLTGAFDNVSVVIRHSILQLATPDNMRGRVSAVNGIFIGSSNEIGAFESGLTAKWWGTKAAIIVGGSLTILVVAITGKISPKLRKLNLKDLE